MLTPHCVYLHSQAGKVFYVGMGSVRRARAKTNRSASWADVAAHGRTVHIVDYFGTPNEAAMAEIDLIDLMRKMDQPLVNKSSGGEGGVSRYASYADASASIRGLLQALDASRIAHMSMPTNTQPRRKRSRIHLVIG